MLANYFVVLVMVIPSLCYGHTDKIDRNVRDTAHGLSECSTFTRTTGWFSCTCIPDYTTMMSKDKETYDCRTPSEIGCTYSLIETNQTYLITEQNVTKKLIYPLSKECQSIKRIFVWDLNLDKGDIGNWYEITNEASAYFTLDWYSTFANSSLVISNLDNKLWAGQLIKIELGNGRCDECLTVKVRGVINYPIDINKFKSGIYKPHTTRKTSTGSVTYGITTTGSVTHGITTTSLITTRITTNSTSSGKHGKLHGGSTATYIIIAVAIAVISVVSGW